MYIGLPWVFLISLGSILGGIAIGIILAQRPDRKVIDEIIDRELSQDDTFLILSRLAEIGYCSSLDITAMRRLKAEGLVVSQEAALRAALTQDGRERLAEMSATREES